MINDAEQPAASCSSAAQEGSHCWVPHSSYELGCWYYVLQEEWRLFSSKGRGGKSKKQKVKGRFIPNSTKQVVKKKRASLDIRKPTKHQRASTHLDPLNIGSVSKNAGCLQRWLN